MTLPRYKAIWLRNSAGGWNVGIRGKRPRGRVRVYTRDGVSSLEEIGAAVEERVFRGKTYTLYVPFSSSHPYRTQYVRRVVRANPNALGWLNALSPHY